MTFFLVKLRGKTKLKKPIKKSNFKYFIIKYIISNLYFMDSEGATKAVVKEILGRTGRVIIMKCFQKGSRGGIT